MENQKNNPLENLEETMENDLNLQEIYLYQTWVPEETGFQMKFAKGKGKLSLNQSCRDEKMEQKGYYRRRLKKNHEFHGCGVCSKMFHSKRALSGHMRAHPERQWRGIQSPQAPLLKNNSSGSSTLSDSVLIDNQIEWVSASGRLGFCEMGSPSPDWLLNGNSRKNVVSLRSDKRIQGAVDGLLLLAHGNSLDRRERRRANRSFQKQYMHEPLIQHCQV